MTRTLWRGSELLGELLMRVHTSPSPDRGPRQFLTHSAYLIPAEGVTLNGVQQMRIPVLDETRVFQDTIEPSISSRQDSPDPTRRSRPVVALEPMTPEEALGVPYSSQLRLVGEDGEELQPRAIWLHERRYDSTTFTLIQNGIPGEPVEAIPSEAYVNGSVWDVLFAFDPPSA
jgi:hypothetical protein